MVVSLALMFCAALQAVAFWWLVKDFDVTWWAMNLILIVVPLGSIPSLYGPLKQSRI